MSVRDDSPAAPLAGARILLADDHEDFSTLLRAFLTPLGVRLDTVTNGAEALARVETHAYDLLLLDIQMPELDGIELARRLRGSGVSIPIIAITAHAMKPHLDQALAAGCDEIFTKPLSLPALKAGLLARLKGRIS
jgi:CheY-like chemotaxis protein